MEKLIRDKCSISYAVNTNRDMYEYTILIERLGKNQYVVDIMEKFQNGLLKGSDDNDNGYVGTYSAFGCSVDVIETTKLLINSMLKEKFENGEIIEEVF